MNTISELIPYLSDAVFELEREVPYGSAFAMEREGETITSETRLQTVQPLDPVRGAVLTAFTGRFFMERAFNDLSPKTIRKAAKELKKAAADSGIRYDGPRLDPGPKLKESFHGRLEADPADRSLKEKTEFCRDMREHVEVLDKRVVSATYLFSTVRQREVFVNRNRELYQSLPRTMVLVRVVMREGMRSVSLHDGHAFQGGWEHAGLPEERLQAMVKDCSRLLPAQRLVPGFYDCVFSPEFSGIFAHEAFGHGTEADMILKRRGRGALFLNKQVASTLVNLYDDPSLEGQAASYFFDHEGQTAAPTQIIRDGMLVSPITDLNSAVRLNITPTANGRRESYANKAYARMSNTYFAPSGRLTREDMIGEVKNGYLLERPSNGMEDPKGWGIQLEGHLAREIKNGKLTGVVHTPVIVTGYVPDLLRSVDMVGGELRISGLGMCGKGYKEWVKVTDGGPYMKLKARLG